MEMTMRCDACKHWCKGEVTPCIGEMEADGLKVFRCSRAPEWWDATEWREHPATEEGHRVLKPSFSGTRMFVQDGSDYQAFLFTAADFFCAHFEAN